MTHVNQKKIKLSKEGRKTKWAPYWVVIRKFGTGQARRRHPSSVTKQRRHWQRTKLKIKPRKMTKKHLG